MWFLISTWLYYTAPYRRLSSGLVLSKTVTLKSAENATVLVILAVVNLSCGSPLEHSNINYHQNELDGMDPNFNRLDYEIEKNRKVKMRKIYGFLQTVWAH